MLGALLGACGEEEFAYIPAEKMHLGDEITSYSVHNVVKRRSGRVCGAQLLS